ncbi:MAG: hypothetical protein R6X27_10060, partial [Candidatus Desulfacyla sp.]
VREESFVMAPSVSEQYIVDEKGNPTAVILPIDEYRKMLSVMDELEDHRESRILSQSSEFKKLVKKGLDDIRAGRTRPWKEAWDEL